MAASFLLVIVGMIYYKAPEDGMITECGSLLPDWKSVSAIFSLYTIVFLLMVVANVWFIQHTRRQAATEVSTWVIFTHPVGGARIITIRMTKTYLLSKYWVAVLSLP